MLFGSDVDVDSLSLAHVFDFLLPVEALLIIQLLFFQACVFNVELEGRSVVFVLEGEFKIFFHFSCTTVKQTF